MKLLKSTSIHSHVITIAVKLQYMVTTADYKYFMTMQLVYQES